jgi:hypothetical protein
METQSATNRPRSVGTAVNLLWTSLAVGLLKVLMDLSHLSGMASIAAIVILSVVFVALFGFLYLKISFGKNWARVTFLVMGVIGIMPTFSIVSTEFSRSVVVGTLSLLQLALPRTGDRPRFFGENQSDKSWPVCPLFSSKCNFRSPIFSVAFRVADRHAPTYGIDIAHL